MKNIKKYLIILISFLLLFLNFNFNFLGNDKEYFENFQADSEYLVVSAMLSEYFDYETKYNLNHAYFLSNDYSIKSRGRELLDKAFTLINNEEFKNNYSIVEKGTIIIDKNDFSNFFFEKESNYKYLRLQLGNNLYTVKDVQVDKNNENYIIKTNADHLFKIETDGLLNDLVIFKDGKYYKNYYFYDYDSQLGLQGFMAKKLIAFMPIYDAVNFLYVFNTFMLAIILLAICYILQKKYNLLFAFSFYIVFLTSTWITPFAKNLYWVEYTWFFPMLIGLWLSNNITNKKAEYFSYLFIFLAVFIKSACGFEYLSTILISSMMFLFTDFCIYIKKDKSLSKKYLNVMIKFGIFALLGFVFAIGSLAYYRGSGVIIDGLINIYKEDISIKTFIDVVYYPDELFPLLSLGLNTPLSEVLETYFAYIRNGVLYFIPAQFFPFIIIIVILIFTYDAIKEKDKVKTLEEFILFLLSLLATLSWLILAKTHSAMHLHMNYVLWYFGFVQICIYKCINFFIKLIPFKK